MVVPPSRSAGSRAYLTRERVLKTALRMADRDGIETISMRRLAKELGGAAMSLYNHISNKDDLLDAMIDQIFDEIEQPPGHDDWRSAMTKRALSVRAVLGRHRWAIGLLESRTAPGPATLSHQESAIRCLRGAGFSIALTARALSAIDSYTYGFAFRERAFPFATAKESADRAESLLSKVPPDQYPALAEMTTHHVLQPHYDHDHEYEYGLALILDRLDTLRSQDHSGQVES